MKLIIDIDKDYYEIMKYEVQNGNDFKPIRIIGNGIPLDNIKTEIEFAPLNIKENKELRCNTCKWNDEELSGECYDCVKGIEDRYEPIDKNERRIEILTKAVNYLLLEKIKAEIGAKVFEIQPTSDKYFGGVDDVMDIVSSIIDKHIKENKQ